MYTCSCVYAWISCISVCVYTCVYMYLWYTCAYMYTTTCVYMYCMLTCTQVQECIHVFACMFVVYIHGCMHTYGCVYACACAYIYVYMLLISLYPWGLMSDPHVDTKICCKLCWLGNTDRKYLCVFSTDMIFFFTYFQSIVY